MAWSPHRESPATILTMSRVVRPVQAFRTNTGIGGCGKGFELHYTYALARKIRQTFAPTGNYPTTRLRINSILHFEAKLQDHYIASPIVPGMSPGAVGLRKSLLPANQNGGRIIQS